MARYNNNHSEKTPHKQYTEYTKDLGRYLITRRAGHYDIEKLVISGLYILI